MGLGIRHGSDRASIKRRILGARVFPEFLRGLYHFGTVVLIRGEQEDSPAFFGAGQKTGSYGESWGWQVRSRPVWGGTGLV